MMTGKDFVEELVDIDDAEKQSENIKIANTAYIDAFGTALEEKGLSSKTIYRHVSNVALYLNHYLSDYEGESMVEGCSASLHTFFDYFFIRKCMWSTPATIKSTATSIRKFYQLMSELGHIEKDDYKWLCDYLKENLEWWQESCRIYNDPDEEFMPYMW